MHVGIAPKDRAYNMVKEHIMNEDEFLSEFGLRSMAKNEPVYNTVETSNPSNWQGPIWIVSHYIIFKGLLKYGYLDEAAQITANILTCLCNDLEMNNCLHEYYNPETGKSNINSGFMNWNALAGLMVPDIINETGKNN